MAKERKKKIRLFQWFYAMMILFMLILSICLAILINSKLQLVNLQSLPLSRITDFKEWIPFDRLFNKKEEKVSNQILYKQNSDGSFSNGSNTVYNLMDCIVLEVSKDRIYVVGDNGIFVEYKGLSDVHVKEKERILKGDILGLYMESINIDCFKGNEKISYESAILP